MHTNSVKRSEKDSVYSTINDVMSASRLLYRILGIDFHGTEQGTIMISKCFFSRTYSSSTCHVISSLDAGMIAGLSGGGAMCIFRKDHRWIRILYCSVYPKRTTPVKKALVVGSGAGGATVAKELQGKFEVTVLEAGREFHPFSMNLSNVEKIKKTGLMFDEREIQLLFPAMKIRKTARPDGHGKRNRFRWNYNSCYREWRSHG